MYVNQVGKSSLDRNALHSEMLQRRSEWLARRYAIVKKSGFWAEKVEGCGLEQLHIGPLAVAHHLNMLEGIECCVEYPLQTNASWVMHLDIWIPMALMGIELDGSHHREREQQQLDKERDRAADERGIFILRFTNKEVWYDFPGVIGQIVDACRCRGYAAKSDFSPYIHYRKEPKPHYVCEAYPGRERSYEVEIHSERARYLGLEYHHGRTF